MVGSDLSGIHACYSSRMPTTPEGFLTVRVALDGQGRTSSARLGNSVLNDAKVESCVVSRLARLRFDPPADGQPAVFAYSFMFSSPAP